MCYIEFLIILNNMKLVIVWIPLIDNFLRIFGMSKGTKVYWTFLLLMCNASCAFVTLMQKRKHQRNLKKVLQLKAFTNVDYFFALKLSQAMHIKVPLEWCFIKFMVSCRSISHKQKFEIAIAIRDITLCYNFFHIFSQININDQWIHLTQKLYT